MKRKFFILAIISIIIEGILMWLNFSMTALVFLLLGVVALLGVVTLFYVNKKVKETNWYKNVIPDMKNYPTNEWYRDNLKRNYDIVNVGSSSALYAFDYNAVGVDGFNWAMQPQSMEYSFKVLKTYFSILKSNGIVLIPFSPFSGLSVENKWSERIFEKYTYILDSKLLSNPRLFRARKYPLLMYPKASIRSLIRDEKQKKSSTPSTHICHGDKEFEHDAKYWIKMWKSEFNIIDLESPMSDENKKSRKERQTVFKEMVEFCISRNLRPVIVMPPIHSSLSQLLPHSFREEYINSFIRESVCDGVFYLDYMDDPEFLSSGYYYNAFFLNKEGAKAFTSRVIKDLKLCE